MAARRLNPRYLVAAALLSVGAAAATFQLKYAVRDLDRELARTRVEITRELWAVQSTRADLAYLTRPERLVLQAGQLGMVPARGTRLVEVGQILPWQQLQWADARMLATLPSGAEVPLRPKPMPLMAQFGPEGD